MLYVGRIAPEKNLGLAVAAYRAMQRCSTSMKFIVVGDGPLRAHVALDFLRSGSWTLTLIRDGDSDRTFDSSSRGVAATDRVDVEMRPRGGFVMRIERGQTGDR